MFTVDKKSLQSIYNSMLKLTGKFTELVVEVEKEGLWLTINVDTYIHKFVPAEVKKTGKFKIQQEVFETLFKLRNNTLECSFNKEQNILNVIAGTKMELYVTFKINPEDLEEPDCSDNEMKLKIKSKEVGTFKNNLELVQFMSPDPNNTGYALLSNSKKEMALTFATTNMFAKYAFSQSLGSDEFELCIPIEKFKLALSMIESELEIILTDKMLLIKSDSMTLSLPTLIDTQFTGLIEACNELMSNSSLMEGEIKLELKQVQNVLDSIRSIANGNGIVDFHVKNGKMILSLENTIGSTKDKCKVLSNDIGDSVKFGIPELFVDSALSMCSLIDESSTLRFGGDFKYFLFKQATDKLKFITIGPIEAA